MEKKKNGKRGREKKDGGDGMWNDDGSGGFLDNRRSFDHIAMHELVALIDTSVRHPAQIPKISGPLGYEGSRGIITPIGLLLGFDAGKLRDSSCRPMDEFDGLQWILEGEHFIVGLMEVLQQIRQILAVGDPVLPQFHG